MNPIRVDHCFFGIAVADLVFGCLAGAAGLRHFAAVELGAAFVFAGAALWLRRRARRAAPAAPGGPQP